MTSPITTDIIYDPSDGVSTSVDGVSADNLIVVSDGEGQPGTVSGTLANAGSEPATVTVALEDRTELATVEVAPGQAVRLDGEPTVTSEGIEPVVVDEVPQRPGAYIPLRLQAQEGGASSVQVPVLPPTGPYEGLGVDQASSTAGSDD